MNKKTQNFQLLLTICSVLSWLLKILPTMFGIIMAQAVSKIVEQAAAGDKNGVLYFGRLLLHFTLAIKLLEMVLGTVFERLKSHGLHNCKMNLYRMFLLNPLHVLYTSEHGRSIEKLNDDFDKATDRILTLYPDLGTGVITAVVYFGIIAYQNIGIAFILVIISLIQLISPLLFKRFFQVNYDSCRNMEALITDFTLGGLRGFTTIRLYNVKEWWLGKLAEYHKRYAKIGNISIYTAAVQSTLQNFMTTILKYGTCIILGLMMLTGHAALNICVQAIALSGGFFTAIKMIFEFIPRLAVSNVARKRINEWFLSDDFTESNWKNDTIVLSNVSHSFGERMILKKVSAQFNADKIYLIKGKNGIGKSTLFHLITGMLPCKGGKISAGTVASEHFGNQIFPEKIFYIMQDDATFSLTPDEMYEMIAPNHIPLILEYTEKFCLTEKQIYETQISKLSGGERKKIYLSLAFTLNPVFLLLDEPTNSLDEYGKNVLLDLLRQRNGGAIIISHDPIFDAVSDVVYEIHKGALRNEPI